MPAFIRINGGAAATDCAAAGASTDFDAFASSIGCANPNVFDVDGAAFGDTTGGDAAICRDSRLGSDFGASAIAGEPLSRTTGPAMAALSVFAIVSSDTLLLLPSSTGLHA